MPTLLTHTVRNSAERFPDREAVRCRDESLTYAQLQAEINRLANLLVDQGVRRRDRVGILMNKDVNLAVAVFGIMQAGAAWVPIDPGAPVERIALQIQDCGIRCLVTHPGRLPVVAQLARRQCGIGVILGCDIEPTPDVTSLSWSDIRSFPETNPPNVRTIEQDLAYIIYTSGSTGPPKGIMHTHRSGLSYARWAAPFYQLCEHDRIGNHAPLHFDIATFDFFASALAGAANVMIPEDAMLLPASYSRLLQDERVSVLFSVPFALTQLAERGDLSNRDLSSLRLVIFGGEPMPPKTVRTLMDHLPHSRFNNMYGPAETNGCTCYDVPGLSDELPDPIPIGTAFETMETIVVNQDGRTAEPGETGELLVRGPTLMRGYWQRPDLNRAVFQARSVIPGDDDRFYRTGDLVRTLDDGNYEFVGRKDRQVKLRGYRIELDEIEAVLLRHNSVSEAAAFMVPGDDGAGRIHAAVLLRPDCGATESELILFASKSLSRTATPSSIDIPDNFPRTTSGKIDRAALTKPFQPACRPDAAATRHDD